MITLNELIAKETGTFYIKVRPDDSVRQFRSNFNNLAQMIIDGIEPKYKDKVLGFELDKYGDYRPVFDEETQKIWDKELDDYISRKVEWCRKYGSN